MVTVTAPLKLLRKAPATEVPTVITVHGEWDRCRHAENCKPAGRRAKVTAVTAPGKFPRVRAYAREESFFRAVTAVTALIGAQ